MKRYQGGDLDALGAMAILLLPKLAAIARGRFSDKNLADEALQEFWIKIIPKDQAEAVASVWLDGYSIEDSAKLLGIPANTVKSRISRGKAALALQLSELDPRMGNQKHA